MKPLKPNAVELAPHTGQWMSGDRYGSILARRSDNVVLVRLDKSQQLLWLDPQHIKEEYSR